MANALVVRRDKLQPQMTYRAAQYVRMSTDHQRYSIVNQAAVIAAYAQLHDISIVRTYSDEGESGLKIKNRSGLTRLLDDVRSGNADFGHVLVYDISRWGRFQDIDESAHYEFICKQAGIGVIYCAEEFSNDGSLISSLVKNIKRVMAAEYSRELSAKVYAGKLRLAGLGFRMGSRIGYGLQRVVVDEGSRPKGVLADGEQKYLITDRVRVQPGTPDEQAVIKWIFEEYIRGKSQAAIWRDLNLRGIPAKGGRPWKYFMIGTILRNEIYAGDLIYNRHSSKLRAKQIKNPEDRWVRSEGCVKAIIDKDAFSRARKRLENYRVRIPEEEMLVRLRKVLMKKGHLSADIIDATPGLPSSTTYRSRFGNFRNLYGLIGYDNLKSRNNDRWAAVNRANVALLQERFKKSGSQPVFEPSTVCLRVDNSLNICFGVAKWHQYEGRPVRWAIYLRARTRKLSGWMIALRLGENNEAPLDYILLPFPSVKRDTFWFGEQPRSDGIEYFENFENLAESLVRRVSRVRSNSVGGKRPKATGPKSKRVSRPRAKTARPSRGGSRN